MDAGGTSVALQDDQVSGAVPIVNLTRTVNLSLADSLGNTVTCSFVLNMID